MTFVFLSSHETDGHVEGVPLRHLVPISLYQTGKSNEVSRQLGRLLHKRPTSYQRGKTSQKSGVDDDPFLASSSKDAWHDPTIPLKPVPKEGSVVTRVALKVDSSSTVL